MLENLILEKSALISYSQTEINNIASTSNHLREIIKNQNDFNESFLGGSYKRGTMVKGISDVYYQYIGTGNPQTALARLKTFLTTRYPNTTIKQDKPSIHVDFDRIPFNITPYKKDFLGINIPDSNLSNWQRINFGELETAISSLRSRNSNYIDLIKILKLWNKNYGRGLKNFNIEQRVINLLSYSYTTSVLPDWMSTFLHQSGYSTDLKNSEL